MSVRGHLLSCGKVGALRFGVTTTTAMCTCGRDGDLAVIAAVWTGGPSSEAARAARGEGATEKGPRARMWLGLGRVIAELTHTLDPAHVPAVRRVVAWQTFKGDRHDCAVDAYLDAAWRLVSRARLSRGYEHGLGEWWEHWPEGRIQRLATWLRHRDEKAGWR